jgi:hypothetical protein
LSQPASHLLLTKLEEQCRTEYGKSLAGERMSGARNVVDCAQYRSQHHEGNKPKNSISIALVARLMYFAYPHGSVQSSGNFVILLQSWTATKDLWQPELAHGTFHVAYLALSRRWCLYPLRRLSSNTAYHIGVCECFRCSLLRLDVQSGGDRLCDTRVERGCSARDDEVLVTLVASSGTTITVTGSGSNEGGVVAQ